MELLHQRAYVEEGAALSGERPSIAGPNGGRLQTPYLVYRNEKQRSEITVTRRTSPLLAGSLLLALLVAACSTGNSATSPSPSAGSQDAAAVAAAVNRYFGSALPSGNWAEIARSSTGQLQVQAKWLASQGIAPSVGQAGLDIQRLQVISVGASEALVSFDATRTVGDRLTTYGGPVRLLKENGNWSVADYTRDGRSVAASVFAHAKGVARRGGVIVTVVGVQLEAGHVDVWVRIENTTSAQLVWDRPIVVVDESGMQLGRGALFVSSADTSEGFEMMPGVSVFGDFVVDNVTLPLSTKSFTLLAGATNNVADQPIDISVPVQL